MRSIRLIFPMTLAVTGLACLPPLPEMSDTSSTRWDSAGGNQPPTVQEVWIQAYGAAEDAEPTLYTEDTAEAIVDASDPDGDYFSLQYTWKVNTKTVETGDNELLSGDYFSRGDQVKVWVTPRNAAGELLPHGMLGSNMIEVSNTPPPAPSIVLDGLDRCGALVFLGAEGEEDVSAPASESLSFTDEMTVDLWLNPAPSGADTTPRLVFGQLSSDPTMGYRLEIVSGQLKLSVGTDEPTISTGTALSPNAWNHIMLSFTWDDSEKVGRWYGFINGERVLAMDSTKDLSFTDGLPLRVGTDSVGDLTSLSGLVHSVRVSQTALRTEDFSHQFKKYFSDPIRSGPNTVALWTFGPPAAEGGQYKDLSGNGNTLSAQGTSYVDSETEGSCPFAEYTDLRCSVTEEQEDPDDDELVYEFHWFGNDSDEPFEGTTHENLDELYQDLYQEDRGGFDRWTCMIAASDGKTSSLPGVADIDLSD